jgi:poly(3-hydroxybutyrate) depolymerase
MAALPTERNSVIDPEIVAMIRRLLTLCAAVTTIAVVVPTGTAVAAGGHQAATRRSLPADAPHAVYRAEPRLPKAKGWPGSDTAFPRTSGTGRLAGGGMYWTDYLYDDHGTTTASTGGLSVTAGSPSFGTYTYPAGAASQNGADIFRAAVLDRRHASYWRVDWDTLVDPRVPIAEWAVDSDNDASTGAASWVGSAGVHSPGIDTAIVVSSQHAQLVDVATGTVRKQLHTVIGRGAHSFVVRIPHHALEPSGRWRIRLAAGLSDAAGTGFAPAADALPGQTAIYNVTFRTPSQEAPADNFWNDFAQTGALLTANVSKFSTVVRWRALRHRQRTRQAHLRGWSDRWYVSDVQPGSGIVTSAPTIVDGKANYLGRVQPYAVYVPKSYSPRHPAPLTFLLHSLTQNHNQYAATTPRFSTLACEDRHSICVTTLGRGPDGNYFDSAELDFWQVWHSVAAVYRLNPNRTVISGYSMGGIGTNQIAMAHPDLFAAAVTLAGAVGNVPSLSNLRWVPVYLAGGAADELVPITVERAEATALQALGERYRWVLYPLVDHVIFELADSFADGAAFMAGAHRVRNPGYFAYTWLPSNTQQAFSSRLTDAGGISWTQQPKLGVGTTGDYWLRHLKARSKATTAGLRAYSGERPMRQVRSHVAHQVAVKGGPGPGVASSLTWTRGARSQRKPVIRLHLTNVRSLRVLPHGAGFGRRYPRGRLKVTTDGKTVIRFGHRRLHFAKGTHVVPFQA